MDFSIGTLAHIISKTQEKQKVPGTLDKDAFLQILTTQLRYQDPMSPMDSDSFVSQMSQFTMLEQLYNIANVMEGMANASVFSDATAVIGKEVKLFDQESGEHITGVAEKVSLANGLIEVQIDGKMYNFMSVYEVKNPEMPGNEPEPEPTETPEPAPEITPGDGAEVAPGDGAEATPGHGAEAAPGDGAGETPLVDEPEGTPAGE